MAVAKLEKFLIVTHKSEETTVLKHFQKKGLAELKPYFKQDIDENSPSSPIPQNYDIAVPAINIKAGKALEILSSYEEKSKKKISSTAGKLVITSHEYESIASRKDNEEKIDQIISFDNEINLNKNKISELNLKINQFELWSSFKGRLEHLGEYDSYTIKLGLIKAKKNTFTEICNEFDKRHISFEVIDTNIDLNYVIIAYHASIRSDAQYYLSNITFEDANLSGCSGTIQENIATLKKQIEHLETINKNLDDKLKDFSKNFKRILTIYLDYLENNIEIEWAINYGYSTENVSFYTAWIKKTDKEKLDNLAGNFNFTRIMKIEPDEDEVIPTVLENKKIFKPFEFIINLYGVPRYFEIDPTPYMALFFALFFGLCLTDAGYGFIFVILSIIIFIKMKGSENIALLVLILGIFTILGGAVFNGWFGDLPSYLGIDKFFSKFAIFGDPMKSNAGAMNFFRLALILGVIQVVFGLFIKFFDTLLRKDYSSAFFDTLPWIVIIISLIIMLLSTEMAVSIQLVNEPIFPASQLR